MALVKHIDLTQEQGVATVSRQGIISPMLDLELNKAIITGTREQIIDFIQREIIKKVEDA